MLRKNLDRAYTVTLLFSPNVICECDQASVDLLFPFIYLDLAPDPLWQITSYFVQYFISLSYVIDHKVKINHTGLELFITSQTPSMQFSSCSFAVAVCFCFAIVFQNHEPDNQRNGEGERGLRRPVINISSIQSNTYTIS